MPAPPARTLVLLCAFALPLASHSDRPAAAPADGAAPLESFLAVDRPIKGDCTATFTFIDADSAGQCAVFLPVPSAFIAIGGRCQVAHLGRTDLNAVQQLVFQLDAEGNPVIVNGQPVVIELRNCSTLTSANGDELEHTTIGDVMPAGPAQVTFSGEMTFVGGTGRFSEASGSADFSGTASLATSTGAFAFEGTVVY
jgi:hypothetical protein